MNVIYDSRMETFQEVTELFKVLMHPTRLAILEMLRNGEECVCHMTAMLGARQAYVSQQLMVLREAGLVIDRRDGWNIYYRVIRPEVYGVLDAARSMVASQHQDELTFVLPERSEACPCPKCQAALAGVTS
jgi:DNA-binding transcriptional ArsR family regulator